MALFFYTVLLLMCFSQSNSYENNNIPEDFETIKESFDDKEYKDSAVANNLEIIEKDVYDLNNSDSPYNLENIEKDFDNLNSQDSAEEDDLKTIEKDLDALDNQDSAPQDNFEKLEKEFDALEGEDITLDDLAKFQERINKLLLAKKDKDEGVIDYLRNVGVEVEPETQASEKDFPEKIVFDANPTQALFATKSIKATPSKHVKATEKPQPSFRPTKSSRSTSFQSKYRTIFPPHSWPTVKPWTNRTGSTDRPWTDSSGSTYRPWTDSSGSTYKPWTDSSGSTYRPWTDNSGSTYRPWTDSSGSTYRPWTDNSGSTYRPWTDNSGSTYRPWTDNSGSTYRPWTDNSGSTYRPWTDNRGSTNRPWTGSSHRPWTGFPSVTPFPEHVEYIGGCHYWGGINQCNTWNFEYVKVDKSCKNDKWFYNCEYTAIQNPKLCEYDFFASGCRESCNKCGKDNYITALKKFEKCGDKIEPAYNMMYSFIPEDAIRRKARCHCDNINCPLIKFCATLKYRRRVDTNQTHENGHSKLFICAESGRNIMDPNFQPDQICLSDQTKEMHDYQVVHEWKEFSYEFYAKCQRLEIVVGAMKESDHLDIDHTALFAGGCPRGGGDHMPKKDNGFKRMENLPDLDEDMAKKMREVMAKKFKK